MHLHHIPARDDIARAEVLQQHAATHTDLLRIDLHQISGLCNSPIFRLANGPWPFSQFPPRLAQPGRLGRLVKHPAPLPAIECLSADRETAASPRRISPIEDIEQHPLQPPLRCPLKVTHPISLILTLYRVSPIILDE